MGDGKYRVLKSMPARRTKFFTLYPVIHNELLFYLQVANEKRYNSMIINHAIAQRPLIHPNILGVFKRGSDGDGRPFVIKEYIPYPTVAELAPQKTLSLDWKLGAMHKVVQALGHARSKGQFHGALSLENVFVDADSGDVKVDNFGFVPEGEIASEKDDSHSAVYCTLQLINDTSEKLPETVDISSFKNLLWTRGLMDMFEKGLSPNPENRPDLKTLDMMIKTALQEYHALLFDWSKLPVDFRKLPESLDVAMQNLRAGNISEARRMLEISASYFKNRPAIRKLAELMMGLGDFESASELISKNGSVIDLESVLLGNAILAGHPIKTRLIKKYGRKAVCSAAVSSNPDTFRKLQKYGIMTNDFAVAAAIPDPEKAIRIFSHLLSAGADPNVMHNNIGATLAMHGSRKAHEHLQRSNLAEAGTNLALYWFALKEYKKAFEEAESLRFEPKPGAVLMATGKSLGLPVQEPAYYARSVLTRRLSERFQAEGIKPADYELVLS